MELEMEQKAVNKAMRSGNEEQRKNQGNQSSKKKQREGDDKERERGRGIQTFALLLSAGDILERTGT